MNTVHGSGILGKRPRALLCAWEYFHIVRSLTLKALIVEKKGIFDLLENLKTQPKLKKDLS